MISITVKHLWVFKYQKKCKLSSRTTRFVPHKITLAMVWGLQNLLYFLSVTITPKKYNHLVIKHITCKLMGRWDCKKGKNKHFLNWPKHNVGIEYKFWKSSHIKPMVCMVCRCWSQDIDICLQFLHGLNWSVNKPILEVASVLFKRLLVHLHQLWICSLSLLSRKYCLSFEVLGSLTTHNIFIYSGTHLVQATWNTLQYHAGA